MPLGAPTPSVCLPSPYYRDHALDFLQIAVPTSAGFGAALGGMAPLLAALSANTPGVTLCNIDNGYGAAAMAIRILKMATRLHAVRSAAEAAQRAVEEATAAAAAMVESSSPSSSHN
mgnify:CR=1 FL=1